MLALSRGHRLDALHPPTPRGRRGDGVRHRHPARRGQQHPLPHHLLLRGQRRDAGAELPQEVPRGVLRPGRRRRARRLAAPRRQRQVAEGDTVPTVKIDGIEVEVPAGTNMIEAARKVGIDIPHYCYHPHLSIAGNCRMCLVDVEAGGRGPDIACNMMARDGLAIRTDTPQVATMRRATMEFLLKNHPLDCPICDQSGECRLQDYYMEYGQYESRLSDPKVTKHKRVDIGDHLVLDAERCIACSRCVRFGDEITGTGELRLFNRTDHTEIGIFPGARIQHDYQGNLADICPVGAITNKDFRFTKRVWYLKETDAVCTECATGCNVRVCHQQGQVFRLLPRRNDAVNKSWMCDHGRQAFEAITGLDRLLRARVQGQPADLDDAVAAAATLLREAGGGVAVVLGHSASNEANWALLKLTRDNLPNATVYAVAGNDPGAWDRSDDFLMDADKNANSAGIAALMAHDPAIRDRSDLVQALADGDVDVMLVLGDDVLGRLGADGAGVRVIHVGSFRCTTSDAATVVLPAAHPYEQDATWTNRDRRVQRGRRAIHPAGDSEPAWALMERLGAALGKAPGATSAAAAFKSLASSVESFSGMTYQSLGNGGAVLASPPSPPTDDEDALETIHA
ncbi:MAG: ferredoxin [Deltaproteobacteria bacterium]|nr:MAG: ferredoxin [Deltaproteobacteria bacterium]